MSLMANVSPERGSGALGGGGGGGGNNSKYSMKAPLSFLPANLRARRRTKIPAIPRPTRSPKDLARILSLGMFPC